MKNIIISNYFRLLRLNNLTGAWLLLLPALWAIALFRVNNGQLLWSVVFFVGAVSMRSAGCLINDIIDADLDKQVERTKNRPLAEASITKKEALYTLASILPIGLVILFFIGAQSFKLAGIVSVLVVVYPFSKRIFYYPQFILAIIFNSGIFFASLAVANKVSLPAVLLYLGAVMWTLYYDTIYAHQDKRDDVLVGIKSMALTKYGDKKWLGIFYKSAIFAWGVAGALAQANLFFYFALGGIAIFLYKQLQNVELSSSDSCQKAFAQNKYVGIILLVGALLGKF